MKSFRWDEAKNDWLEHHRGVRFEQIAVLIENSDLLDVIEHPDQDKYPGQKIAVAKINEYAYLIPYEQRDEEIELITIIPSRKATRTYLGDRHEKSES